MPGFLATAILAAALGAPNDGGYTESVDVYICDFEHHDERADLESDINYDNWPDRWTCRTGPAFPKYLKFEIQPETNQPENHGFVVELNGGGAEAFSPKADVGSLFSYRLHARLKTEQLKHDTAFVSITFYGADDKPLESYYTKRLTTTDGWEEVHLGPITPKHSNVRYAKIGVHVRPGEKTDIWGRVIFDDIRLMRLPRMQLTANKPFHFYECADNIEISCQISGIHDSKPTVQFELIDVYGRRLQQEAFPLQLVELKAPTDENQPKPDKSRQNKSRRKSESMGMGMGMDDEPEAPAAWGSHRGFESLRTWRPSFPEGNLGYYEVRATIRDGERLILERQISLVIARPVTRNGRGPFGWSVKATGGAVSLRQLAQLIEIAGVNWVKLPIWFGDDLALADEIAWFAERMSANGVDLVGVMDSPPVEADANSGEPTKPPIALLLVEEDTWKPLVNPVMTRLSLKMRWWQLGADDDVSYVGFPDLPKRIGVIKTYLQRFGQEVRLGFSWPWLYERPEEKGRTWSFISYRTDVPLTPKELKTSLSGAAAQSSERWTTIKPLAPDQYSVDARARDLVLRMLEADINGSTAIFAADPFHPKTGLVKPDGTPNDMLLPWRTTTSLVSGSQFVGSIQMPNGSRNYVLSRGDQAIMVVWNDSPVEEVIYVGENVRAYDVWGRMTAPEVVNADGVRRQVIRAGVSPTFLTGVSLPVAQWRMAFDFDRERLASTASRAQRVQYKINNPFPRSVSMTMHLRTPPKVWEVTPTISKTELHEGESRNLPFEVKLDSWAPSGPQKLRADFRIMADRPYEFSVYRSLEVGLGEIEIDVETELDRATGKLIVYVHLDNNTDRKARFNCLIFIKGRRRMRMRLSSSGRGRTTNTLMADDGGSLIGKTIFVQARELGGGRVLNFRLDASE